MYRENGVPCTERRIMYTTRDDYEDEDEDGTDEEEGDDDGDVQAHASFGS